jgi:acetyltransferase-like isoleucine patch superfamily enzyme
LVLVAVVLTAPLWLTARLEMLISRGDGFFASCSELLSLFPGKPGIFLRRGFYWMCLDGFAIDCHVGFGTTLAHPQARIGPGVYIGNRCTLGQVAIGTDVTIGSNVDILSGRHQHGFECLDRPIQDQQRSFAPVRIGRNCWIGNSAVILANIDDDSVIGAGSVVVHAIPARSVAAGNPAQVKRIREATLTPAESDSAPLNPSATAPCFGS